MFVNVRLFGCPLFVELSFHGCCHPCLFFYFPFTLRYKKKLRNINATGRFEINNKFKNFFYKKFFIG